jgi:hypothetical protein
MDESRPPVPPSDLLLRPASERTSADIDPPPEPCGNDPPDGPLVAVYYRNEEEVREGFLIALRAMGLAGAARHPEPATPPAGGAKAVKTRNFPCLLPICMLLFACGPTASRSSADSVTFDTAARLDDFDFAASRDGRPGKWSVIDNDAGRGLARIGPEPNDDRMAFALYRRFSGRDVYVSTRFLTIPGRIDQAAGLFVRFRSPDDHYAVRADALENSVTLYRIVAGRRETIGGMDVNVSGQAWHTLGIAASEDRLTVFFDGRELFVATDRRFPGPPGKVGLWTRAGSMTLFESLEVSTLH